MRIRFCLTLLALCLPSMAQRVSITWIGQSCFVVHTDGGPTVVTDPPVASVGYTLSQLTADVVTITHNHTDHNNAAGIGGQFALVDGRPVTSRQEMTAAGMNFVMIPGFHDNQNGALRGPNTIIRWTQAGMRFAHLGDLGQDNLTDAQLADLQNIDVLFVPAGGFFTVTPDRAAAYVKQLNPRVAILMHYKTALGGPAQLAALPASAAPFAPLTYKWSSDSVSLETLPVNTEVWVMQPQSAANATNSATFVPGMPVAPGSLVSAIGTFSGSESGVADQLPLPRKIAQTEVMIDGKAVPVSYVSPGQANFQMPAATSPGQSLLEVRVGGQTVSRGAVTVVPNAPGLFSVLNQDGSINSADAPAHRGETIHIYATGVGATASTPDDGAPAPDPAPAGMVAPIVFLQRTQFTPSYNGLVPGAVGLWRIDVQLPADAPTGSAMPLTVVNGLTSNTLMVNVQQ